MDENIIKLCGAAIMDLSLLDKSSHMTPMLVRLYDSQRLYTLAEDKDPTARGELITAVYELLEMELTPRESELVADVMIALMRQAEEELRSALAERMSVMEDVPLRLVLHMANDKISVASPILKNSIVLSDMDLLYIIKSKSAEHWRAIAMRRMLSDQIVNVLAETGDIDTAITLVENTNIVLNDTALVTLSDMAQGSKDLATPLLRREEVPADLAAKIYSFVGSSLKDYINQNFNPDGKTAEVVDEIMNAMIDLPESDFAPTRDMVENAQILYKRGELNPAKMVRLLRRGAQSEFMAQFSCYTKLPLSTVEEILKQESGQGLAVACKACDISKTDFLSIYLLSHRMRASEGDSPEINAVSRAVDYYNRITPLMARDVFQNSVKGSDSIH